MRSSIIKKAQDYKKNIAKKFIAISPDEIEERLKSKEYFVTRKVDGEFDYLHFDGKSALLVNGYGKVKEDLPILRKVEELLKSKSISFLEAAVELHIKEDGKRVRVFELLKALANDVDSITISPFDLIMVNEDDYTHKNFKEKYKKLSEIFDSDIKPVELIETDSIKEVKNIYDKWVLGENAEGLVIKNETPLIYKVKPINTLDVLVLGFTVDDDGLLRQMLVGLKHEDDTIQEVGRVGTGFGQEGKVYLLDKLKPLKRESDYIFIDKKRRIAFQMIEPKLVIEIKVTEILAEYKYIIQNPILEFKEESGYHFLEKKNGISLIHPRYVRLREDKTALPHDVRFSQVGDIIYIHEEEEEELELRESEIIFREVYTKKSKGKLMVQKFLVWKTNKSKNKKYPEYVLHYTNYSAFRKEPLKKDIRISNSREQILELKDQFIAKNVKKGWKLT